MAKPEFSRFIEGLVYEDKLPLRWTPLAELPAYLELSKYNYQNSQILQVLLSMDHPSHEIDGDIPALTHDLERLDGKLNLLLGMVGQLLGQTTVLPPVVPLGLGGRELVFVVSPEPGSKPLPAGPSLAKIDLFLNLQFPSPLCLVTEIHQIDTLDTQPWAQARYLETDTKLLDLLEKFIFRQHRRSVAMSRHPGGQR